MPIYQGSAPNIWSHLWGDGFMSPGGERNRAMLFGDRDIKGKRLLDIGCGGGGPGLELVEERGVELVGIDAEPLMVEGARRRAKERGLEGRAEFHLVDPGPFGFADSSFDITMNNGGALMYTEDKLSMIKECYRVLKPSGLIACYDWMSREVEQSEDFASVVGDKVFMMPLEHHGELLREAGFIDVELTDDSDWYREEIKEECRKIREDSWDELCERFGEEVVDDFINLWTGIARIVGSGELRTTYFHATKPS